MSEGRTIEGFSTLEDFLIEEGIYEEVTAQAVKEVIAWQIGEAMKERGLSRSKMAELMGTSRAQVARLLDPDNSGVTLETLLRAAKVVGRRIRVDLV